MSIRHVLHAWRTGEAPQMTKEEAAQFRQGVQAARIGQTPQPCWTQEQRAGWVAMDRVLGALAEQRAEVFHAN